MDSSREENLGKVSKSSEIGKEEHLINSPFVILESLQVLSFVLKDSDTAERILALQTVPLLILDDLGRERIRGSYAEDWAASQLDGIINHRYRHEMPILWTTNVPAAHLVVLYGSALVSRLTGDNPLIWFNDLPDMRAGI